MLKKQKIFFITLTTFVIFSFLIPTDTTLAACPTSNADGLIYCQDFEGTDDWTTAFRNGAWNIPDPDLVQKVSYDCHTGNNCIRGNLRSTVVDPITGAPGIPNQQFEWAPASADMDEVFFRYWYRLDDATWAGLSDRNEPITGFNTVGKLMYITDQVESTGAYYMGGLGRSVSENGVWTDYYRSHPELWGQYYSLGERTTFSVSNPIWITNPDATWHKVEIYSNHIEHYMKIWLDDNLAVSVNDDGPTDGLVDTHPDFKIRGLQFWYTRDSYLSNSIDGPETAGSFEIDDLEMWNYNVKEGYPQVNSANGIFVDRESVTVSGSSFGNKDIAQPVLWDDFEQANFDNWNFRVGGVTWVKRRTKNGEDKGFNACHFIVL